MSSPHTRLGEAEKQLRLAADDIEDERKASVARQLSNVVGMFREGVPEDE